MQQKIWYITIWNHIKPVMGRNYLTLIIIIDLNFKILYCRDCNARRRTIFKKYILFPTSLSQVEVHDENRNILQYFNT